MFRIDWSPVDNNSSSIDAVGEFADGASIKAASDLAWDPKVKAIFRSLGRLPVKVARKRAQTFVRRNYR